MATLNSVGDILRHVRELVEPFTNGAYVPDWERRSATLSALSDYLVIRIRDDAFVHDQSSTRAVECEADTGYRKLIARGVRAIVSGEPLAFPEVGIAVGEDARILRDLCSTLDYSEKVAMSAAAFAIETLSLSSDLLSVVANILFEEAYHLHIITELLGLDQSARPWLAPDKAVNWELVKTCEDGCTYMLLEHVLFEARGAIAAAKGGHEARPRGLSEQRTAWLEKICDQETNHGIAGLVWFNRDEGRSALSLRAGPVVRRFIEQECDDTSGTFRTLRQRYSTWLLARYLDGASIEELLKCLKGDVKRCKTTGEIGPTLDDVTRATDFVYNVSRNGGE